MLRWSWRVGCYTYGVLGTDRYPPLTLAEVPGYPATLDVAYPEHLSRGLVLVKWWLLAIPHYIVVGFFVGGGSYLVWQSDRLDVRGAAGGLIGILVLIAAVILAVTGHYPHSIFDLVLGLNRWVLRVGAYAGLMTDKYPPFRLDLGGNDPGSVAVGPDAPVQTPTGTSRTGAPLSGPGRPQPGPPQPWTAGRVVALVVGALMAAAAVGLVSAGVATLVVDRTQRDDAGLLTSDSQQVKSASYAVVSEGLDLNLEGPDWLYARRAVGDVRLRVSGANGEPVFVGIAPEAEASAYLGQTGYDQISDLGGGQMHYRTQPGQAPPTAPAEQTFWAASASGAGTQELTWPLTDGRWQVVVMNADGSAGVAADADIAAQLPLLTWVAVGLLAVGAVLLLGAALPIYLAARSGV